MSITRKLFSAFSLNILIFLFAFAVTFVLSNLLEPENFGKFRFILVIASTISLFANLGFPEMIQLQLAKNYIRLKDYLASTLLITMPVFFLILGVLFYILFTTIELYHPSLLISGLFYCLIFQINLIFHNAIFALDKLSKFQILDISRNAALLLIIAVLYLFNNFNIYSLIWCLVFVNTFSMTYVIYLLFKKREKEKEKVKLIYSKELVRNSFRTYVNNLLTFFTYRGGMYILRLNNVSFYQIGIYSLAVTLSEKLWVLPESIRSVLYLEMCNERKGVEFIVSLLRLLTFIIIILGVIVGLLSYFLIPIIFPQYENSIIPFLILLPGTLIFFYTKILASYFIITNKIRINTHSSLLIAVVSVGLSFYLIPRYGILGATVASSIAYSAGSLFQIGKFAQITHSKLLEIFVLQKTDFQFIYQLLRKA